MHGLGLGHADGREAEHPIGHHALEEVVVAVARPCPAVGGDQGRRIGHEPRQAADEGVVVLDRTVHEGEQVPLVGGGAGQQRNRGGRSVADGLRRMAGQDLTVDHGAEGKARRRRDRTVDATPEHGFGDRRLGVEEAPGLGPEQGPEVSAELVEEGGGDGGGALDRG